MENPWDPSWTQSVRNNTVWEWDVVGDNLLVVHIPKEVSWFRRLKTKLLLGSKWKRKKTEKR
jgi:hypothetical protein